MSSRANAPHFRGSTSGLFNIKSNLFERLNNESNKPCTINDLEISIQEEIGRMIYFNCPLPSDYVNILLEGDCPPQMLGVPYALIYRYLNDNNYRKIEEIMSILLPKFDTRLTNASVKIDSFNEILQILYFACSASINIGKTQVERLVFSINLDLKR
jgi:predicted component of type VI protein secretion system